MTVDSPPQGARPGGAQSGIVWQVLMFDDLGFDSLLIPLLVAALCMLLLRVVAAVCSDVTERRDKALIAQLTEPNRDARTPTE